MVKANAKTYYGNEIFKQQTNMQFKMFFDILFYLFLFNVFVTTIYILINHIPFLTVFFGLIKIWMQETYTNTVHICYYDANYTCHQIVTTSTAATHYYSSLIVYILKHILLINVLLSLIGYPIIIFLSLKYFKKIAHNYTATEVIRGTEVISVDDAKKQLNSRYDNHKAILYINNKIYIPHELETRHVLVAGATGAGKTTLISQFVDSIKHKCIIYDYKPDYITKFYNNNDIIMNPLDKRCIKYNIFSDIENELDIDLIVQSIIPQSLETNEQYWRDGARYVFKAVIILCLLQDKKLNTDLFNMIKDAIVLYNLFEEYEKEHSIFSIAKQFINPAAAQQQAGILSTLTRYTQILEKLVYIDTDLQSSFSIKKYIRDSNDNRTMYITTTHSDFLRPFISLIIDLAMQTILLLNDDQNRRIYLIIDEFATLQKLHSIVDFVTLSRSKGGCMIAGIQSISKIFETYNRDANTIIENCNTHVVMRVQADSADFFSRNFGKQDVRELQQSVSFGPNPNFNDTFSLQKVDKTKDIVLSTELTTLNTFECFVKIDDIITRTTINKQFYDSKDIKAIDLIDNINFMQPPIEPQELEEPQIKQIDPQEQEQERVDLFKK